jgi:high affinity Mn2+ porin
MMPSPIARAAPLWIAIALIALGPMPKAGAADASGPTAEPQTPSEQPQAASPEADATPEGWAIHGQTTFTDEYHPAFRSPYSGAQSLNGGSRGDETWDVTLYGGLRLWHGAEVWVNPEVNQGFGLSNTFGVAGFPSAESYKLGAQDPYVRVQRVFLRQTIDLDGEMEKVDPDQNVLGGSQSANRIVLTVGKFAATDVFDTNKYAHDARNDFLNWSVIDAGTYDYAGDAWGYSYAMAAEWYQDWWTIRAGLFDLPTTPGYKFLNPRLFSQVQYQMELEERHTLFGQPGKLKLTGFLTRGDIGLFKDAITQAAATGTVADTGNVPMYRSRGGVSLNLEQQITEDLGLFFRAGWADGSGQIESFTDIDVAVSGGVSLSGNRWGRPDDTVGLAVARNDISRHFKNYLNDGGVGILIGDGILPNSGPETIIEGFYSLAAFKYAHVTADYQFINNPAYNADRGPVSVLGIRLHAQF